MGQAEFKSGRFANAFLGVGLLACSACVVWVALFMDETQFLGTHVRPGGIIKVIEQSIGWPASVVLMTFFGAWLTVYAVVSLWKAFDGTADVTATQEGLYFTGLSKTPRQPMKSSHIGALKLSAGTLFCGCTFMSRIGHCKVCSSARASSWRAGAKT